MKSIMRISRIGFCLIMIIMPLMAISQVNIKIHIDNQADSVYYLYKYRGSKTAMFDTAYCTNGSAKFVSKHSYPEGIYVVTNENRIPLTEILIGKDQKFSLNIKDLNDLNTATVKGAKETEIYYKLIAKLNSTELNISALESETEYYPDNVRKIDSLKNDLAQFEESLKIKKKDAFINLVINSVKQHGMEDYWDDFQLDDKRILTYPLIDNKLATYFDNLPINAEIINAEIDKLIAKTGDCVETRDYLIWYFYRKYYSPNYMNLDDIYIHLVDEYFLKLEMENVSESIVNLMAERANYLENLKLGAKLPEIGSLYSIESQYIAVIFFDKTCQKCAQEGRILEEIRTRHPEMTIYPVEIHSGIKENILSLYDIQTTPMIYLLDSKKKIIAKRIKAGQVEQCLNMD